MPRFFLSEDEFNGRPASPGDMLHIIGSDAEHVSRSLRMERGDSLTVCDSRSVEYLCTITGISQGEVSLRVESLMLSETEPCYSAVLYQALPKAQKFEVIVQKAVETGVSRIVPVITERCISRPDEQSLKKKRERWQKIAEEAAKQCGRAVIPKVSPPLDFGGAVADALCGDLSFLCYEGSGTEALGDIISADRGKRDIRFIVGAEGGFSVAEAEYAASSGLRLAGLGKRILRCETAGPFVLSCICYENELRNK